MPNQLFNDYAAYLALGFLLIYVLAQLLVSKHPRFQQFTPIQKSVTVKLLALVGFTLAYILFAILRK